MSTPIILDALKSKQTKEVPFWFMRQAGRYLSEYQEVRKNFSNFLEFCYTPDAACEVTLQPITKFGFSAAILFCDILVIPDALGQEVSFVKGEGPKLKPITHANEIEALQSEKVVEYLSPVYESIRQIRKALPEDKALIGFSGSPWTLACYMIEGGGSKEFATARSFAHQNPEAYRSLISILEKAVADYAIAQVDAGAQVIQLFDSWSGLASAQQFQDYVTAPTQRIVSAIKAKHPNVPIIGFAKSAGTNLQAYAEQTGIDAVGLDHGVAPLWAKAHLSGKTLQGNLDNLLLASDLEGALKQTNAICDAWEDIPFIFNLGHGIVPHTPVEHVQAVVETIKQRKRA